MNRSIVTITSLVLLFVAAVAYLSVKYRRSQTAKHRGTYLGILIGVLLSPIAWFMFIIAVISHPSNIALVRSAGLSL